MSNSSDKKNKLIKKLYDQGYLVLELPFEDKLSYASEMQSFFNNAFQQKNLDNKFQEIKNVIDNKGFEFAALKYSVSSTSNLGGKLDWINENSLNKKIKSSIDNLKINEFTKPIILPGGFLILKINDIKKNKVENHMIGKVLKQELKINNNIIISNIELNEAYENTIPSIMDS